MRRLLRGNRGRPAEGAATIEQVRHRAMGSAGEGRSGRHLLASKARAWAERPPLWGSDDVSAMRNYRYRHRDSPYVARRSGERTSRAGRPWAVGGELPGARWRGRPVCARGGRPCGGSGGTNARVSVFFIHIHPRLRRAGRGGAEHEASAPWGGTRAAGREAQAVRGNEESGAQGRKTHCATGTTIGAAGRPFAQPWASALSEPPFRPRRKPRAPVRMWPQRPG